MGVADYGTAAQTTAAPSLADWAAAVAAALDSSDVTVDERDAIIAAAAAAALAAHEADTTAVHGIADPSALAPLASPTFTGTPAAPTAAPGTDTTQLATTAFVGAAVAASPGVTVTHPNTDDVLVVGGGQTIHYDSGWRNISASLINGWTGSLYVRRIGYLTYWQMNGLNPAAATSNYCYAVPTGFSQGAVLGASRGQTAGHKIRSVGSGTSVSQLENAYFRPTDSYVNEVSLYGTVIHVCTDTIPTSLPGTLVSAAPA